jgi:hypothetical protein
LAARQSIQPDTTYEPIQKGRRQLAEEILSRSRRMVPEYGIELIDVVARQIRYSDELTQSVYARMIKERNQIAQAFRSEGEGKKAGWLEGTMVIWGPHFDGMGLDRVICEETGKEAALDALRYWINARLLLEEQETPPFPWPAGALVSAGADLLFPPVTRLIPRNSGTG